MLFSHLGFFEISLSVLVFSLVARLRRRKNKLPLPPGPPGLPIIGNAFDIPLVRMPQTYLEWTRRYRSDVVYLEALGKKMVIINGYDAATELLDKRSQIYSCRPQTTFLGQLMDLWWLFAIMPYGEEWKERRRSCVQHFPASNLSLHQPKEVHFIRTRLLPQLVESPGGFMEHVRHVIGGVLISFTYGIPVQLENDPLISLAEEAMAASASGAIPGKYLVDVFSFLKYVPEWFLGAGFKRQAREWKDLWRRFTNVMFQTAEEHTARGGGQSSFVSSCLEAMDEKRDIEKQKVRIKETAITLFAAGADTLGAAIIVFILAMTLNPEVQAKAQAEIDRVLESGRLPEFSDQESLPYVTAVMKETLRWQPPNPQAVPHLNTEDDTYMGYHIPKGSIVIPNVWAMSRDEKRFPEPEQFQPERFLTSDGKLNPKANDPFDFVFGFGRRKCVGTHVAVSTLWMTLVSILATLKISKARDERGNIIEPVVDFKSANIVALPSPFKCSIKPRSREAEKLIFTSAEFAS
ncbi:O-methylsterigmatocystin oxidoreductase [Leucoagaricus sp. SymC.cos]|nr:O-methylsterigmatocystin oxidoreductase [Leucoagaricus sp. SymC.cos]